VKGMHGGASSPATFGMRKRLKRRARLALGAVRILLRVLFRQHARPECASGPGVTPAGHDGCTAAARGCFGQRGPRPPELEADVPAIQKFAAKAASYTDRHLHRARRDEGSCRMTSLRCCFRPVAEMARGMTEMPSSTRPDPTPTARRALSNMRVSRHHPLRHRSRAHRPRPRRGVPQAPPLKKAGARFAVWRATLSCFLVWSSWQRLHPRPYLHSRPLWFWITHG